MFLHLDSVTFDERAGAANTNVNIAETVVPDTVAVNGSLDYKFTGTGKISGGAWIEKSGNGKLTIGTNDDRFGPTIISSGTLQVGARQQHGKSGDRAGYQQRSIVFNRTTGVTVPGEISGNGTLEKRSSSGTVTLTGNNTYTGTTTITAGTLQIGSGGTSGTLGTGNVLNDGTLTFNRGNDAVVSNTIGGTGDIKKVGAGFVQLAGLNSYAGATTIGGIPALGGLIVSELANGGLPSNIGASTAEAANLAIQNNATLRYIGPGAVTDRLFTIGNATIDASGSGALVFNNPGTMGTSGGNRTLTLTGCEHR